MGGGSSPSHRQARTRRQQQRRRGDDPHGSMVLLCLRFRRAPGEMLCVGLEGAIPCIAACPHCRVDTQSNTGAEGERKQLRRVHEILGEPVWDSMGPGYSAVLPQMKESGGIWPVSEKINGFEALSSLKVRFRSTHISLGRDLKPD